MMKKVFITIIPMLLLLASCNFIRNLADLPDKSTESWQTVFVSGVGSFRVPIEWNVEQEDGVMYSTNNPRDDEEHTIYLIGTICTDERKYTQPHELLDGVEKGKAIFSNITGVYSNSAYISLFEYAVNGIKKECYLIKYSRTLWYDKKIVGHNLLELLVWDQDAVDEKTISEIAKTFTMER